MTAARSADWNGARGLGILLPAGGCAGAAPFDGLPVGETGRVVAE